MNKTKKRGWWRGVEGEVGEADGEAAHPPGLLRDESLAGHERPEDATIDTVTIFESAGVSGEDRERVERARALLKALPNGGSPSMRKEIVETALKVFGVPTDRIQ